jgi:hypothetical protein
VASGAAAEGQGWRRRWRWLRMILFQLWERRSKAFQPKPCLLNAALALIPSASAAIRGAGLSALGCATSARVTNDGVCSPAAENFLTTLDVVKIDRAFLDFAALQGNITRVKNDACKFIVSLDLEFRATSARKTLCTSVDFPW